MSDDTRMTDEEESGPIIFDTTPAAEDLSLQPPIPASPGRTQSRIRSNLDLIAECDSFPYYERDPQRYHALTEEYFALAVPDHPSIFGYILPNVAAVLSNVPGWELNDSERTLTLAAGQNRVERSALVAKTCIAMRETGAFEVLKGWRDELYPVYDERGEVLFEMERAASALFGIVTYGVHMTAYTRTPTEGGDPKDEYKIWVPRRARTKQTYGGMLDNTVAGGIAVGEVAFESLVREAHEEASLDEKIVRRDTKATGVVSYFHIRDERAGGETNLLQPECQYVYDLELDEGVTPKPCDDEVEEFKLMTVREAQEALAAGEFKPNCSLVLLDFFVRHGILTISNERDYLEINARLHRLLEFPVARA